MKNPVVQNDIMRYKKNKLSGNLALLSIVFECLYFLFMYKQTCGNIPRKFDNGTPVYTYQMGISVILNLVLLLTIFLSSEELKGYNKKFCYVVWVIAAIQLIRIVGYPITTYNSSYNNGKKWIFEIDTLIILIAMLVASAGCLIAAGVTGFITSTRLEKYKKDLDAGMIDLDAALKEEESETEAPVQENESLPGEEV